MNRFDFVTDTSTLCVFDLECLKHRLKDDADWWSINEDELAEVNDGNVAFIGLGEDGDYTVELVDWIVNPTFKVNLKVPSGKVFIGAAEEVTADGFEPECIRGGRFVSLGSGDHILSVKLVNGVVFIAFEIGMCGRNEFANTLSLI